MNVSLGQPTTALDLHFQSQPSSPHQPGKNMFSSIFINFKQKAQMQIRHLAPQAKCTKLFNPWPSNMKIQVCHLTFTGIQGIESNFSRACAWLTWKSISACIILFQHHTMFDHNFTPCMILLFETEFWTWMPASSYAFFCSAVLICSTVLSFIVSEITYDQLIILALLVCPLSG